MGKIMGFIMNITLGGCIGGLGSYLLVGNIQNSGPSKAIKDIGTYKKYTILTSKNKPFGIDKLREDFRRIQSPEDSSEYISFENYLKMIPNKNLRNIEKIRLNMAVDSLEAKARNEE